MGFYFFPPFISTVRSMGVDLCMEKPISLKYGDGKTFNIQVLRVNGLNEYNGAFNKKSAPDIKYKTVSYFGRIPEGIDATCLDLSEATFCDSVGLSAILVYRRLGKNEGIKSENIIVADSGPVRKLLELSDVDAVFNIHSSVDDMVKYYENELLSE
jgi:ABC-type transporter Mla MlaB component